MKITESTKYERREEHIKFNEIPVGMEFIDSCQHVCLKTARDSGYVHALDDYVFFGLDEICHLIRRKIVTTEYSD